MIKSVKFFILSFLILGQAFSQIQWDQASPFKFELLDQYLWDDKALYQTEGFLIIYQDRLVYEKYAHGHTQKTPHLQWSIAKSFINTLYGIAEQEGLIERDEAIKTSFPSVDPKLTVRHLLNMSSGLNWTETYESNPFESSVIAMLYTLGFKDMARFVAMKGQAKIPGSFFRYSSGDSMLLMGHLKKKLGDQYQNYPWEKLFKPLGLNSAVWEMDAVGNFIGSSYLYLTARDMAKWAKLYLDQGKHQGRQLLSKDWIKFSSGVAPSLKKGKSSQEESHQTYGAHFWLNLPNFKGKKPYPTLSSDLLYASGHHGQNIFIFPSHRLIIVRTAFDKKKSINKELYLNLIMQELGLGQ